MKKHSFKKISLVSLALLAVSGIVAASQNKNIKIDDEICNGHLVQDADGNITCSVAVDSATKDCHVILNEPTEGK